VQLLQQPVSVRWRLRDLCKLLVFRRDSVNFLCNLKLRHTRCVGHSKIVQLVESKHN